MTFHDFFYAENTLAMVITVDEYEKVRPILKNYYTEKELTSIDDYAAYKPGFERFLLCNSAKKASIISPMMLINAVTFVDRVPFRDVIFEDTSDDGI